MLIFVHTNCWDTRDYLFNIAFILLWAVNQEISHDRAALHHGIDIELLHRWGLLAPFSLFFSSFFILFFSFIPDNYHQYKICMFVCMYTYIHVYVCIYKDINNARELHSLQRSLFQKSLPVTPSHDKNQGSYYRRYYKIFTLRFVLCFLCCRYMVFTKSCIAILTNASVQMAGRGILLACFIGSSQGIYSLF